MTTEPCEHFRGLIAMEIVGQLSDDERVALVAHVDGCAACREERHDLSVLPAALEAGDPDHFGEHELPFRLQSAVLQRLRVEERHERRARRSRIIALSAVAATVAGVALAVSLVLSAGNGAKQVDLQGPSNVHAFARLTPQPWGTQVDLRASGQKIGQVVTVDVSTTSGTWWQVGTYRTVGGTIHVTMGCALKMTSITGVGVRSHTGRLVLYGDVVRHHKQKSPTTSHHT
jgi:Putative zinc-finger